VCVIITRRILPQMYRVCKRLANAETGQVLPKPHIRFGDLPSTANSFKWISGFAYVRISGDVNQFEPAGH
jgi:hypothetical protein